MLHVSEFISTQNAYSYFIISISSSNNAVMSQISPSAVQVNIFSRSLNRQTDRHNTEQNSKLSKCEEWLTISHFAPKAFS